MHNSNRTPISVGSDRTCFLCGGELFTEHGEEFIYWHGSETDILLHLGCAEKLAVHLIKDVRTWESADLAPLRKANRNAPV